MRAYAVAALLLTSTSSVLGLPSVHSKNRAHGVPVAEPEPLQEETSSLPLDQFAPIYHSASSLKGEVMRLASSCSGATLTVTNQEVNNTAFSIDFITVRAGGNKAKRIFLLAGEHPEEVIGPEALLYFLRALCGDPGAQLGTSIGRGDLLEKAEFGILLNANPGTRQKVDSGDFCVRSNFRGVDLDRNWDDHWSEDGMKSGAEAFSEPETQALKSIIADFQPNVFVSMRSGGMGMYMPWAYSEKAGRGERNQEPMLNLLRDLSSSHCEKCHYGAAGAHLGYPNPGSSLDYVYDKLGVDFAFIFEIWGGVQNREKAQWDDSPMLLQTGRTDPGSCLARFNPLEKADYDATVQKWTATLVDLTVKVSKAPGMLLSKRGREKKHSRAPRKTLLSRKRHRKHH